MGRPTGPREDSGDGCPFLRRSPPRPGPLPEDRSYFEEPDITVPVGPVVLDAPHQTRQQAPSQVRLFGGHGIEDRHSVGTVGRPERQRARLEQAGAYQLLSYASPGALIGGVRHRARPVGAQLVGEGVVPFQAGDFLDQVHLAGDVGTPARDLHGEPPVFRRDEEPHRGQQTLYLRAFYGYAEEVADALQAAGDRAPAGPGIRPIARRNASGMPSMS